MGIEIKEVLDVGNDVLIVRGEVDGVRIEARGWVSATTNHVDVLQPEGEEAQALNAREMSLTEKRGYCEQLLADASVEHRAQPKLISLEEPVPLT